MRNKVLALAAVGLTATAVIAACDDSIPAENLEGDCLASGSGALSVVTERVLSRLDSSLGVSLMILLVWCSEG